MGSFHSSEYVSEEGLQNLKLYQYRAVDKSYLTHYFLRHYWNAVVELFPLWIAPNMITLSGFVLGIVINMGLVLYYMPDLVGPGPWWVYISCGLGMWLYSTFDNVDGKQARRTKTSSPLGELFDHGFDAVNSAWGALVQVACLGMGQTFDSVFLVSCTMIPFYLTTWEEYHTGVMYLGVINGPTEGLVASCLTMFASGIFGVQIWHQNVHDVMTFWLIKPAVDLLPADMLLKGFMLTLLALGVVFAHAPFCFWAVYGACREKGTSYLTAILQLTPMITLEIAKYTWLLSPHSTLLKQGQFALFTIMLGIVFGRVATKIILSHVTKMEFPMFTILLMPLCIGAFLVNTPALGWPAVFKAPEYELYYLWGYLVFAAVAYLHWAFLVIDKFCTFLGINCLTIRPKDE